MYFEVKSNVVRGTKTENVVVTVKASNIVEAVSLSENYFSLRGEEVLNVTSAVMKKYCTVLTQDLNDPRFYEITAAYETPDGKETREQFLVEAETDVEARAMVIADYESKHFIVDSIPMNKAVKVEQYISTENEDHI